MTDEHNAAYEMGRMQGMIDALYLSKRDDVETLEDFAKRAQGGINIIRGQLEKGAWEKYDA